MKKILIFQPQLCVGGVEKVLLTILKYIDYNKFDITLLMLNKTNMWDELIPHNVHVQYLFNKNPKEFNPYLYRIYKYGLMFLPGFVLNKLFIKNKYDLYISFHEPMIYFLRAIKGKKIAWVHADYTTIKEFPEIKELKNRNGFLAKIINKRRLKVFNECNKIICVANTARIGLINKYNISNEKVICNYNPIDINEILSLANEKIHIDLDNQITFCSVGRLSYEKALHRVINAAYQLKKEGYRFKYIIVGDGPQRKEIEQLINNFNLNDNIFLIGYDRNPYKYISKCDFLVCSSLYEALSTVVLESIILGKPVVTTECSGMREIFGDYDCGLIVENCNESMYHGIKKILDNEKKLHLMKESASKRARDFNTHKLIKDIELVLENL